MEKTEKETEKVLNAKQERLLELIKKKKECDKRAQEIVYQLIEKNVTERFLLDNVSVTKVTRCKLVANKCKACCLCVLFIFSGISSKSWPFRRCH